MYSDFCEIYRSRRVTRSDLRDGSLESLGEAEQMLLEQEQEEIPGEFLEPMALRFQAAAEQESIRRLYVEYLMTKYSILERVYRLTLRIAIWSHLPDCIVTLKETCDYMEEEAPRFLPKEWASQSATKCNQLLQHVLAYGKL